MCVSCMVSSPPSPVIANPASRILRCTASFVPCNHGKVQKSYHPEQRSDHLGRYGNRPRFRSVANMMQTVCFNRLIDENTDFLYRRLSDRDTSVKKTCLMTLTFLILAGQVKVKGQLGEMAKCLEDEDRRIADLAKMFFTELSTKDNAIYNGFTDIFSLLSTDKHPLEEDSLKRIVKFLMSFIEKV